MIGTDIEKGIGTGTGKGKGTGKEKGKETVKRVENAKGTKIVEEMITKGGPEKEAEEMVAVGAEAGAEVGAEASKLIVLGMNMKTEAKRRHPHLVI